MKKDTPKRFAIIGTPGSGKSTFAIRLGKYLNIPVHHLDNHVFVESGKKRDAQDILVIQKKITGEESWIIEGCSISALEMRFARADTVVYLHFSRFFCVWRVFKRLFTFNKTLSNTGCAKVVNWKLLKYIWNFEKEKNMGIMQLKTQYPLVDFRVFRNSLDVDNFLNSRRKIIHHD